MIDPTPQMNGQARMRLLPVFVAALALLIVVAGVYPAPVQGQEIAPGPLEELSPEQQLAERYAPVAVLKRQRFSCDPSGEAYLPLPIDAVMDDPSVILRLDTGGKTASHDLIVMTGPSMTDLAWLGPGYYLDYPGNPLRPGCWYEHWSKSKAREYEPTVYAHIATEEGVDGLALQYWLFWVFNDFNNRHEGDWEMIQLTFSASTAEEALAQEPESITYAQHGGGERAGWDDTKVHREGSHPVIYAASGSHASYFDDRTFLGWGPGGTGFGCDVTTRPGRRVPLNVVLIPEHPQVDSQFGWLFFRGRWGEKQTWEYNAPVGPHRGRKWREPVSWVANVRERSIYVSDSLALGPTPSSVFCTLTDQGSKALMFFTMSPVRVASVIVALFAFAVYLFAVSWKALYRAARLYLAYWGSFSTISLILVPIGFMVTSLQHLVSSIPPGSWIVQLIGRSDEATLAFTLLLGGAQSLLEAVLIGPAVIAVIQMIRRGEPTDAGRAYRQAWANVPTLLRAWARIRLGILLRALTVIGLPLAIRDTVRWEFFAQAVMLEGAASASGARGTSAAAVTGSWWKTAVRILVFSVIGILPGPLIGIILMVTVATSIPFVHALSGVIYAVTVPYSVIGLTLLYLDLTGRPLASRRSPRTRGAASDIMPAHWVAPQTKGS